jgi:hypothetical protein
MILDKTHRWILTATVSEELPQANEMFFLSWFEIYVGLEGDDEEREEMYRICLETARELLLAESIDMNLYFSQDHMNKLYEHLEIVESGIAEYYVNV